MHAVGINGARVGVARIVAIRDGEQVDQTVLRAARGRIVRHESNVVGCVDVHCRPDINVTGESGGGRSGTIIGIAHTDECLRGKAAVVDPYCVLVTACKAERDVCGTDFGAGEEDCDVIGGGILFIAAGVVGVKLDDKGVET